MIATALYIIIMQIGIVILIFNIINSSEVIIVSLFDIIMLRNQLLIYLHAHQRTRVVITQYGQLIRSVAPDDVHVYEAFARTRIYTYI